MPRYFFHTQDGRRIEDEDGTDLPGLEAAKETALRLMAEILREHGDFWVDQAFSLLVHDAAGRRVLSIEVTARVGDGAE